MHTHTHTHTHTRLAFATRHAEYIFFSGDERPAHAARAGNGSQPRKQEQVHVRDRAAAGAEDQVCRV